jgi:hypothetical protein
MPRFEQQLPQSPLNMSALRFWQPGHSPESDPIIALPQSRGVSVDALPSIKVCSRIVNSSFWIDGLFERGKYSHGRSKTSEQQEQYQGERFRLEITRREEGRRVRLFAERGF